MPEDTDPNEQDDIPLQDLLDDISKGTEQTDTPRESTPRTLRKDSPEGENQGHDQPEMPLHKLAEAIANRGSDPKSDDSMPEALEDSEVTLGQAAQTEPSRSEPGYGISVPTNIAAEGANESPFSFIVHFLLTTGMMMAAVGIYLVAELELIPPQWWVLALPMLTLGILGAIPLLSWWLEIWQPQELR